MKESELRADHLIFGIFAGTVISYMLSTSAYIGNESAFMLTLYNYLFVALTFPLNGRLTRKLCMLLIGNAIGLFWNYLFSSFAVTLIGYFGDSINTLYMVLNPFINLIWIVSFWSLTLTTLANSKSTSAG